MGAQCFATTPNQHYNKYFECVKVSQLKDQWSTIKLYKLKKIYDKSSSPHPQYPKHTHVNYQNFIKMFPQLLRYQQCHKKRIYQIFDQDNHGYIDWNNFYSSISICYFANEDILSILMFMIFDDYLAKQLNKQQLTLLCDLNAIYAKQIGDNFQQYSPQQIVSLLLKNGKNKISIQQWLKQSNQYFNFGKFRRIFNIFMQEKLEKQLVSNYYQWNNLYNQKQQRYISYVISYKWFDSWKIYVQKQYGITLSTALNPTTIKTKAHIGSTQKSLKNNSNNVGNATKKIVELQHLRQLKLGTNKIKSNQEDLQEVKNFDFIHSNIGERPRAIYNNVLQGQYEEVLKPQLVENRDYVLVSGAVWESLKAIYQGFPQFRRTGYDVIEMYPKIVKIYSSMFRQQLDYSSQVIREVSGYITIQNLLTKSIQLSKQQIQNKIIFFKTIGMIKWQQINDLQYMFSQLTPDVVIFLAYINQNDLDLFRKRHQKIPKDITDVNVGDYIIYSQPTISEIKRQKFAVFMGKNVQGKYVLHFPGESYIYDICLLQGQVYKYCKIDRKNSAIEEIKPKNKLQIQVTGIANIKGIGFVNSVILHLLANKSFRQALSLISLDNGGTDQVTTVLAHINMLISSHKKVDPRDILDMIQILMQKYQNFQISMCQNFIIDFLIKIKAQMQKNKLKNIIQKQYISKIQKNLKCLSCNQSTKKFQQQVIISLSIPQKYQKYYQIIFVPYCQDLQPLEIKRYGFKLKINATLKDYQESFQKLAQINSNKLKYLLVEIYSNNIIKNYSTANVNRTLQQLHLRDTDHIYAFQLCTNFDKFIREHYTQVKDITSKQFKIDQFIDCKNNDRGWIFGKISDIQFLPYTHRTLFRVIHKFSKNQQWQISYDFCQENIAKFPTKSYLNAQQYHFRLLQRYFNQASNQMQICNIPLIIVLTNWMRWKQFYYLIYLQIKRFIQDDARFKDQGNNDQDIKITSGKTIQCKSPRKKSQNNKYRLNKFKQYLYGPDFPYRLNFVDRDGRCAICFKFLKTVVFKGQNQTYCQGCQLSHSEPISWQIKPSDVMVCVDWINLSKMKKNLIKNHSSYANLITDKKNDIETLTNCYKNRFLNPYIQKCQDICCNKLTDYQIQQKIFKQQSAQNLIIYLQRIVQENGYKKIINQTIHFQMDNFQINNISYQLIGATSIEGVNKNSKYRVYILNAQKQWLQYDGESVKVVKKSIVQKICALVLYYRKNTLVK